MGVFSWNCKVCGLPILVPYATNKVNKWMNQAVAIDKNGKFYSGSYDGYGKIACDKLPCAYGNTEDITINEDGSIPGDPVVYHSMCWIKVKQPLDYTSPSPVARNQGYFFEEGEYDIEPPDLKLVNLHLLEDKNDEKEE